MAGKSLLSRLGARKGKYKVDKNTKQSSDESNHMEGKYRQTDPDSGDGPPAKKRKTGTEGGADDFDDDWGAEMTQADFEDLDLQASQAYTEPTKHKAAPIEPQPSTSTGRGTGRPAFGTFRKPSLSRSSSSTTSSGSSVNVGPQPPTLGRIGSSHSGSSSNQSNHSAYPSSLSGYSGNSSSSLKSGSSLDLGQPGSLGRGVSNESLDVTGILGHQQSEAANVHKQENIKLKLQLERLKEEMCIREGENKLLRDNLNRKGSELDVLKMERLNEANKQVQQQSEREKTLQNDVSKLQTQLEFKNEEERELMGRCRDLESQVKNLRVGNVKASPPRPQVSPKPSRSVTSEEMSPKIPVSSWSGPGEEKSPRGRGLFPTRETFLSTEASPSKQDKGSEEDRSDTQKNTGSGSVRMKTRQRHVLRLKLPRSGGSSSGSQLVANLLELAPTSTGGIMKLFNNRCTSTSVYNVQFDRDKDTSLLSPVKSRLSDIQTLMSQSERPEMIRLVSEDHYNLALQGLTQLLRSDNIANVPAAQSDADTQFRAVYHRPNTGSADTITEPIASTSASYTVTVQCPSFPAGGSAGSSLDSAMLLLPLISDYLRHYADMLDTSLEASMSASTANGSSSSPESLESYESSSGSLGQLLNSTANFANDLESLVLVSLRTLYTLVICDNVRHVILAESIGGNSENSEPSSEGSTGSEQNSIVQRFCMSSRIPYKIILKSHLLRYIIRLANPGPKGRLYNTTIVQTCLQILQILSIHAENEEIDSLMPLLSSECVQNCIECGGDDGVVLHGMVLLKLLCHSNTMVSAFCTNTPGCVLQSVQAVYTISIRDKSTSKDKLKTRLQIFQLVIQCLSMIASCHKGGLTMLLDSDCQCSVEVVGNVIMLLHNVMELYLCEENRSVLREELMETQSTSLLLTGREKPSQSSVVQTGHEKQSDFGAVCYATLQEGLHLLHLMYQHDPGFINRHFPVQHLYVQLICGLSHIFKHVDSNEIEMSALQDLWDFNQDDSELSQESDSDMEAS